MSWSAFHFPSAPIKLTPDLQQCIWMLHFMSWNSINSAFYLELSDMFLLQAGGLRLAAPPTWMAYITPARPAWFATMALSGTTGKVRILWQQWQPWWCARQISDVVMSDKVFFPPYEYERYPEYCTFGGSIQIRLLVVPTSGHLRGVLKQSLVDMCRLSENDCGVNNLTSEKFHWQYVFSIGT